MADHMMAQAAMLEGCECCSQGALKWNPYWEAVKGLKQSEVGVEGWGSVVIRIS